MKFQKPFRMWAAMDLEDGGICDCYQVRADAAFALRHTDLKPVRVLITPLTPESVESLAVTLASVGMTGSIYGKKEGRKMWDKLLPGTRESWLRTARIELAAIGIT